jgi:[ribosomal protein S18]-alanine N-acetyltransferase
MNFSIREMEIEDIPQIMEIENEAFINPWKEKDFMYEINDNPCSTLLVAESGNEIVGFIDFMITFNSSSISQIATKKTHRHRGIASKLMDAMFEIFLEQEDVVETCTLEVRTKNLVAEEFYEKQGFRISHTKFGYYTNGDDAYYMVKVLI